MGPGGVVAPEKEGPQAADRADPEQARGILTQEQQLPRERRLVSASDLRRIIEGGRRRKLGNLDVYWTDNSAGHPRMGLIVPRFQSTAVARNRLRRRIREIWRRELQPTAGAVDVVVRARRSAYGLSFDRLRSELRAWNGPAGRTGAVRREWPGSSE